MASSNPDAKLLVIVGPTAVGKTATSVQVAKILDGEIVSADSMQVYRGMNIGTSKITPEEMQGVPHHLINVVDPGQPFSVAEYVDRADKAISEIRSRGKRPIIVGGTGLYVRALVDGFLFDDPGADYDFRRKMHEQADQQGLESIHKRLAQVDPDSASRIHPNDLKRVIRALEVYYSTGQTLSDKIEQSKAMPARYEASFYGLTAPREVIYARVNDRVEVMLQEGLVNEVMNLLSTGFLSYLTSNQAIGYKEVVDYLSGKASFAESVTKLQQATRNYAKRQLSWFRGDSRITWFDASLITAEELAQAIAADYKEDICTAGENNFP